jgi:MOSC domain-containing protein
VKVGRINITPVKGLGLQHPTEVELTPRGVEANRRFYLISGWRLFNGKDHGPLVRIAPSVENGRLTFLFPDGRVVDGDVELGEPLSTSFWGRQVSGRLVVGPWADALSDYAGTSVQLVRTDEPGMGTDVHVGTLLARASCERLGEQLAAEIDPRRFRMLFDLDGGEPHEEDTWDRVRIGEAVVRVAGPVARCSVTTQDPRTGVPSLDTLGGIKAYRGLRGEEKKIDFGVYFDVVEPGRVRVGDAVEPLTPP